MSDEKLAILAKRSSKKYLYVLYMRYRSYGYSIIENILKKTYYYGSLIEDKDAILIDALTECIGDFKMSKGKFKNLLSAIISHKTCKLVSRFSKDGLADYVSIDTFALNGDLLFADSECVGPINPKKALDERESRKLIVNSYCPTNRKIKYIIDLKNKGYSYTEIANKSNKSQKAIRQLFYRIRKNVNKKKQK